MKSLFLALLTVGLTLSQQTFAANNCSDLFRQKLSIASSTSAAPDSRRQARAEKLKTNPLVADSRLSFNAIAFDQIKTEHFLPAFADAIKKVERRIEFIRDNPEAATFQNTIEAIEAYNEPLERVNAVFAHFKGVMGDAQLSALANKIYPRLSKISNALTFDKKIVERVKSVYDSRKNLHLSPEQARLLTKTYANFRDLGFTDEQKLRLDVIESRLSLLTTEFSDALTRERAAFELAIDQQTDTAGLSQDLLLKAKERAQAKNLADKFVFDFSEASSILGAAENRELRKSAWQAVGNLGRGDASSDNRPRVLEIAKLREERARIFGVDNHAELTTRSRMAKTPETVFNFLDKLAETYKPAAEQDLIDVEAFAGQAIEPWDFSYFAERLKAKRYSYDSKQLRSYFQLDQVLKGFFYAAHRLYGVTFVAREDLPTWNNEVRAFEVKDRDGNHLALFYMDPFERPGQKRAGAWMNSLTNAGLFGGSPRRPVVVNVTNIKPPEKGKPALLSLENVITVFHEGGHALHSILTQARYRKFAGTNVAWDFVELPSQFMENYALESDVMDVYARHYQTGERIPAELVKRVQDSQGFLAGTVGMRQLRNAYLDLAWHSRDLKEFNTPEDVARLEEEALKPHRILPNYGQLIAPSFSHIFSGGYSAGYYSYKWADVLASDAFEAFKEQGVFNSETANRFQKSVLEKGGTDDADVLYKKFRGKDADPEAILRKEGLLPPKAEAPLTVGNKAA